MKEADKLIVFDTETTGLDFENDEILQLSIINSDGEVLFDRYFKPEKKIEWPEAQKFNGISPEMVKDLPGYRDSLDQVKAIFENAETLVAYNNAFDVEMLKRWGINLEEKKQADVMKDFALLYGEYQTEYNEFKWQKLSKCAEYFGYSFNPHNSLEDVKATLYCYEKMEEMKQSGEYDRIVTENIVKIWGSSYEKKENKEITKGVM